MLEQLRIVPSKTLLQDQHRHQLSYRGAGAVLVGIVQYRVQILIDLRRDVLVKLIVPRLRIIQLTLLPSVEVQLEAGKQIRLT